MTENDTFAFDPEGNAASALGFSAVGVHAGFRADPERLDMALVVADEPCAAAATFTTNVFCAAPVRVSREHLNEGGAGSPAYGCARAVVVNSGIANAATGEIGLENARKTAELVGEAVGCPADEVLVASTGVIGQHLRLEPFAEGVPAALAAMAKVADDLVGRTSQGLTAARAIMTTDTCPKHGSVSFSGDGIGYPGVTFTVGGMCKGAGMIMPNMATMIAVITTDVPIAAPDLSQALTAAVNKSFNKVTVDSDTSTNDTCVVLANGLAGNPAITGPGEDYDIFFAALRHVCEYEAKMIASDGEGAGRLITCTVMGAETEEQAEQMAKAVVRSPLVKCAVFGTDANWGRVLCAIGYSGAQFDPKDVEVKFLSRAGELLVCAGGQGVAFDEALAKQVLSEDEVVIQVTLTSGSATCSCWGCDLTYDYVKINGDYRS